MTIGTDRSDVLTPTPSLSIPFETGTTAEGKKTTITTTAKKIDIPENTRMFRLVHRSAGKTLWIGKDKNITDTGSDVFPLVAGDILSFRMGKNNQNNLYAIVSSADVSIDVYVLGVY